MRAESLAPSSRRRRIVAACSVAVAGLLAVLPASVANADFYGNNDGTSGWKPDNSEHTYCWGDDYTGDFPRDAGHASMQRLQNQPTMTKNYVASCSSNTDARFATGNLPSLDGRWECTLRNGSYCLHAVLTFDRQAITSYDDWRQTTCHEVGHSVGLAHGAQEDCMGASSRQQNYSPHHVNHINDDRF